MKKALNLVFTIELTAFLLIITGVLPRFFSIPLAVLIYSYIMLAPPDDALILFTRSIPLFLAIPITKNFDSLNTWRIASILIFAKWFFRKEIIAGLIDKIRILIKKPVQFVETNPFATCIIALFILALFSSVVAGDKIASIKKIIYFSNLSLIGIVATDLIKKESGFGERLVKNIFIPVIIAALAGLIQLTSTYFWDIYQFFGFWGQTVQCNQFGHGWCEIATKMGNTWFAYFGDQLSLRIFSLFPDSHSFPIFLLLGLPAVFAVSLKKLLGQRKIELKDLIKVRVSLLIIFVPLIFLMTILSGTRGIWLAGSGAALTANVFIIAMTIRKETRQKIAFFKYISLYLVLFFLLFLVAYPIFASPQFLLSKGNTALLSNRFRSIIDFGETSNKQRIEIWKKSFLSIEKHPLLGVGIGNFPIVLDQDISLAKAGSSAHNLYLHIAAEMGLLALIITLWFIWLLIRKAYLNFMKSKDDFLLVYFASALIFIPWVFLYSLTDVAIFDERTFLLFSITAALIIGFNNRTEIIG